MPKTRSASSVSHARSRKSPRPSSSSCAPQPPMPNFFEDKNDVIEWEDVRCPICIEHPHNAVLLICSSYNKGCHPYMCDTSYRHSNCLDQFCKSFADASLEAPIQEEALDAAHTFIGLNSGIVMTNSQETTNQEPLLDPDFSNMHKFPHKLVCPLCRGQISGWIIVESARRFMNTKPRSCACETCDFSGNYQDLRKHARHDHPLVRPSVADPERQRSWRRLERQRDIRDVLSTIQSSLDDDGDESGLFDEQGWLTIFFLIRFYRPSTTRRSSWSGTSRTTRAQVSIRRRSIRLWGGSNETDANSGSRDEDHLNVEHPNLFDGSSLARLNYDQ
ncbi:hypothetical protein Nepgr_006336 [Nepenthes gracilis]|uniref:Uncharacterized protein n=1 Tax=Nepenthes gracilis TaxID=150966 RepID=A0AAD3S508_NEPGR|nr:hypothetical protein Nepgr_006336 [Nepenthes gracilis]